MLNQRPINPVPKPTSEKKRGGKSPKEKGTRLEREIAKKFGGERTPMSGAAKYSNRNLTGDVEIPDADGKPLIKIEAKYSGSINANGEKCYSLTQKVLKQMTQEAIEAHELGALYFRFKNDVQGYAILTHEHFHELVELAKLGATLRK